ncbi:ExbD/TolR family protein [Kordiimonas sp.]|uniref:ExbD/TolR family protein n=1 Tax=Kordiimonas sp. TaxID=1970157 RepID=UPI003A95611C
MRPIRTKTGAQAKADMTPMLDIVFIMLIFFIVTATFMRETGIRPNMPQGSSPKSPLEPIAFQIDAENRIFYAGRLIDPWLVEPIIKGESVLRPKAPVVISINPGAHTGAFVRLHDEARKAGMPNERIAVLIE